jgi:hypothetical protein
MEGQAFLGRSAVTVACPKIYLTMLPPNVSLV